MFTHHTDWFCRYRSWPEKNHTFLWFLVQCLSYLRHVRLHRKNTFTSTWCVNLARAIARAIRSCRNIGPRRRSRPRRALPVPPPSSRAAIATTAHEGQNIQQNWRLVVVVVLQKTAPQNPCPCAGCQWRGHTGNCGQTGRGATECAEEGQHGTSEARSW